ncbi:hypothetical protein HII36_17425 [Nonomuraea sp. NN258]|uniref:terpene synthase family protein n=1 Tax=Nonomuraea antri TaxID=2730852 RepID=UPI001568B60F|nr:hypothetical protein [Nonomuraea antri]NRQ33617.1 hypothetical protein [Nonomuraea antri]
MATGVAENLELPPIFCPLEPAINPAVDRVERRAVEWIERFPIYGSDRERAWVVGTNSADFYARFAPYADEEPLLAASLWVYWGFAFDDARCDAGRLSADPAAFAPMAAGLQRALERPNPAPADDAYGRSLQDIAARFRRLGTPVQFQRFVAAHRAWLSGVIWQIANQAGGRMPGVDDYLTMRLHSAGGEPTFAMLEIANGQEVPAAEMDSPAVRALTEMAILVAGLDNDRHSLVKELGRQHTDQNIYTVLMHHVHPELPDAVHAASCMRDRVLSRFVRLREAIRPRLSTAGRLYLDGLAFGIRGNAEWGQRVPRYVSRGDDPGATYQDALTWADSPLDGRDEPLPYPTVSWWWDPAL